MAVVIEKKVSEFTCFSCNQVSWGEGIAGVERSYYRG